MNRKQFRHLLLAQTAATVLRKEPRDDEPERIRRAVAEARAIVHETYRVVAEELAAEQAQTPKPVAAMPEPVRRASKRFVVPVNQSA